MKISFPPFIPKQKPKRESLSSQMERAMHGSDKRVLFVEDDEHFREYITDVVAPKFDADIVCCERSSQANKRLEEETFDAAILDVRVTNGNGVSLYQKIMERWPSLQVIFLTGYDSSALREEIERIGPARIYNKDSMLKPMFFESLMAQIGVQRRVEC